MGSKRGGRDVPLVACTTLGLSVMKETAVTRAGTEPVPMLLAIARVSRRRPKTGSSMPRRRSLQVAAHRTTVAAESERAAISSRISSGRGCDCGASAAVGPSGSVDTRASLAAGSLSSFATSSRFYFVDSIARTDATIPLVDGICTRVLYIWCAIVWRITRFSRGRWVIRFLHMWGL